MTILSIDTSCDDTAAAVTDGNRVLSNVIWSQASLHAKWGGVVPSLAKRAHTERLPVIVDTAIRKSKMRWPKACATCGTCDTCITAIAVTVGPGLAPALEAGIHYAKQLALLHKIPIIPVNHLEGHIMSSLARPHKSNGTHETHLSHAFALIVSGGHTELVKISSPKSPKFPKIPNYHLLASTLDDALGEALDKAARMLGLGYPGGAVLERFAKAGNPQKYKLPLPLLGRENQGSFSFSGLKTAFYRLIEGKDLTKKEICDLAASFQATAFDHLIRVISKTIANYKNYNNYNFYDFLVGGGVAANLDLRRRLRKLAKEFNLKIHFPYSKKLCTDNAAMIGLAAQWALARGEAAKTPAEINLIDRQPNLNFETSVIPSPAEGSSEAI